MKVRILSGNQAGAVVEMGKTEAESAVDTGFAEWWVAPIVPAPVPPKETPEESAKDDKRDDHED